MKKLMVGGLTAVLAAMMFASLASADPHHPTGEFTKFGDCPLSRATITDCIYFQATGGEFTIGKKTVPIVNPVTLRGGFEGGGSEISFFGAEDGNTFSKTPQPVPGGLFGINAPAWWPKSLREKFNKTIDDGFTGVKATVELAAPATAIKLNTEHMLFEEGTAIALPVKVKLENRLLGNDCYIGSNSNPFLFNLTTGTTAPPAPNKPIKGVSGSLAFNEQATLLTFSGTRFVDNSFAAPKAAGCGGALSFLINPLVNSILGTPSAPGRNTAILEGTLEDAASSVVKASEQ